MNYGKSIALMTLASFIASAPACRDHVTNNSANSSYSTPIAGAGSTQVGQLNNQYLCEVMGQVRSSNEARKSQNKAKSITDNDLTKAPSNHLKNRVRTGNLEVFYLTNSWALYDNDKRDLTKFLDTTEEGSTFILEGYADFRGSDRDNEVLGTRRSQGIKGFINEYLREKGMGNAGFNITSFGESKSQQSAKSIWDLRTDRRVTIIPNKGVVVRALENLPAKYYLMDMSGSMAQAADATRVPKYQQIVNYTFERGSRQFTFADPKPSPCNPKTRLSEQGPQGGTPLYNSLLALINKPDVESNTTITVLSDGSNNVGGSLEQVIQDAKAKNIKINVAGLLLDRGTEADMKRLVNETGGKGNFQIQ